MLYVSGGSFLEIGLPDMVFQFYSINGGGFVMWWGEGLEIGEMRMLEDALGCYIFRLLCSYY